MNIIQHLRHETLRNNDTLFACPALYAPGKAEQCNRDRRRWISAAAELDGLLEENDALLERRASLRRKRTELFRAIVEEARTFVEGVPPRAVNASFSKRS